jgi:hypothetical protein
MRKAPSFLFSLICLVVTAIPTRASDRLSIAVNKQTYSPGETIQFQALLLNSLPQYSTLFAVLMDCSGNVIDKKIYPFNTTISWGGFILPQENDASFYILYCYTINSDTVAAEGIKKIWLTHTSTQPGISKNNDFTMATFFEGNSFIAESANNILVKCTDHNGNGIIVSGKITDEKGLLYGGFTTNSEGYAKAILNPENNVQYSIIAVNNQGVQVKQPIPRCSATGITLNVSVSDSTINYSVLSYNNTVSDYEVEATMNAIPVYTGSISFDKGLRIIRDTLQRRLLPEGLITFRVMNRKKQLMAQRIIYHYPNSAPTISVTIVDTVNKRTAVTNIPSYINGYGYLNIFSPDSSGPVYDKTIKKTLEDDHENVLLQNSGDNITLNDLLITSVHFTPAAPAGTNASPFLTLSGTVLDGDNRPVKHTKLNLVFLYRNLKKDFLFTKTNNKGRFEINNLEFYDSVQVYYTMPDMPGEKININFKVSPGISITGKEKKAIDISCTGIIAADTTRITNIRYDSTSSDKRGKTLSEVIVKSKIEKKAVEKYKDRNVSGQHNQSNFMRNEFDFISNPPIIDNQQIFDFLRGRIAGLMIEPSATGQVLISTTAGSGIGVYLNDMEVDAGDLSSISYLHVSDLALVRYYSMPLKPRTTSTKTRFGNGLTAGMGGDLMIYTKRDYVSAETKARGLPKAVITGYAADRMGIINNWPTAVTQSLYWRPNWRPQKNELIYIGLPANTSTNTIQLIIEGVNEIFIPYSFSKNLVFN